MPWSPLEAEIERAFWRRVIDHPDPAIGCWLWTGPPDERGYGHMWDGKNNMRAHRYAYESAVGKIPPGLDLDHLCSRTMCVKPRHLEPVTQFENSLRARLRRLYASRGRKMPLGFRTIVPDSAYLALGPNECLI